MGRLGQRADLDVELLDLRTIRALLRPGGGPAYGHRNYDEEVTRWAEAIERGDGYLVVTAEYNHGYPAVLKNAFDHIFPEWNRKPISFIGYGNSGGARAIEQLRLVAVELELAPLRHAVHVLPALMVPAMQSDPFDIEAFASLDEKLDVVASDLIWWAEALAPARAVQT